MQLLEPHPLRWQRDRMRGHATRSEFPLPMFDYVPLTHVGRRHPRVVGAEVFPEACASIPQAKADPRHVSFGSTPFRPPSWNWANCQLRPEILVTFATCVSARALVNVLPRIGRVRVHQATQSDHPRTQV